MRDGRRYYSKIGEALDVVTECRVIRKGQVTHLKRLIGDSSIRDVMVNFGLMLRTALIIFQERDGFCSVSEGNRPY